MAGLKLISTAVAALLVLSCAVAEFEAGMVPAEKAETHRVLTRSSMEPLSRRDSLRLLYEYQTNKQVLLNNYIVFKDGEYQLCISRPRAMSLGVDSQTYDDYVSYVAKKNERQ